MLSSMLVTHDVARIGGSPRQKCDRLPLTVIIPGHLEDDLGDFGVALHYSMSTQRSVKYTAIDCFEPS